MEDDKKIDDEQTISRFAMTEYDDVLAELEEDEHDHVHVEGCCSCHSNVGK